MSLNLRLPILSLIVVGWGSTLQGSAQNLETIGKEPPLKVGGGLSLSQIFYGTTGISRRDPYSYFLTGNLNASVFGFNIPLSFAVSNQSRSFQQPFNQFSLSPTYKWATAHVGYASMSFSPYTLGGHIFRGVGIDLKPERFVFSAMYGQLKRAVAPDTLEQRLPSFERWGWGMKAGYREGNDFAELSVFHAEDQQGSLGEIPADNSLLPEENLAVGLSLGKSLFERFALQLDWGGSALTRDMRTEPLAPQGGWRVAQALFQSRTSTSYYQAVKAGLQYQIDGYSLGGGYERIDPGYRTHGAYFFNNDLENYTLNASGSWMESRLSANASGGIQRDNLDRTKISTLQRWVGSVQVAVVPNERLQLSTSYSNFQSFTNIRSQFVDINQLTPFDNLDTLRFTQISQSVNLNAGYTLQTSSTKRQIVSCNLAVQDASERQQDIAQNSGSRFYNINTSYTVSWLPLQMNVHVAYNLSRNESAQMSLTTHGPSTSLSKTMLQKKLRLSLTGALNTSGSEGTLTRIINVRNQVGYRLRDKHQISAGLVMVSRQSRGMETARSFTEFTGTLNYNYSF